MSQEGIQKSLQIPELRFPNFSDDEWKTFYLNDLSNKISDGLHSTPNYVDESNIFFINGNNLINGNIIINDNTKCINFKEFQKYNNNLDQNTILISINGTIGNLSFFNNENIILSKSVAFIKLKENTDKFFIYYLLQTNKIKYYFESELTGTTIRNLSLKSLKNMNIKIPTLEEQKKIGTFLSEIDTKIALMEQKLEKVNKFKKYLLQNLFTDNKFKTQNIPKIRFPEFKEEWINVRLMDISNIKGGKRLPKGYYLISEKNKHPYITVSDMNKGSVNLKSIKYVPEDVVKKISKYTITDKDIFISVAGTLGIIGIIPSELNGANLTENADKITDIKIDQNFLFYLLNTDIIKKLIHRTKTDNAQPKLALKEIRKLEFYYPKNTKEERKIASFLSNIDEKINLIEININLLKKYKKGLLQKLFI